MPALEISKADRAYILQGLRGLRSGYARELVTRIEATKCKDCRGTGYAPYVGGDDDDVCLKCEGAGF